MILKKYLVNSLEEAEEQIHRDLGPNAVILTMRQLKYKGLKNLFFSNNMEVVAAVDENDLRTFQETKKPRTGIALEISPTPVLATADLKAEKIAEEQFFAQQNDSEANKMSDDSENAREWESPMQTIEEPDAMTDKEQANAGLEEPEQYESSNIPGTYLDPRFNRKQTTAQNEVKIEINTQSKDFASSAEALSASKIQSHSANSKAKPPAMETTIENFERVSKALLEKFGHTVEVKGTKGQSVNPFPSIKEEILQDIKENNRIKEKDAEKNQQILKMLTAKGISENNAKNILKRMEFRLKRENGPIERQESGPIALLRKEISSLVNTSGPVFIAKGEPTVVALAGPPGSGKTSSLAKIAVQYLEGLEKKVAVIGFGLKQIGAKDYLKALCTQLSLPLAFSQNKEELKSALNSYKDNDLILIDTPGYNKSDKAALAELSKHLEGIQNLQVHLVLNAGAKESDALALIEASHHLKPFALIMTRADETDTLGTLVNICQESGLSISYLSIGPDISTGLQIADPNIIAKMIL